MADKPIRKVIYEVEYKGFMLVCKLYKCIEDHHSSINRLTKETDISDQTIKNYARGNSHKIDLAIVERICENLNCTISDIFEFRDKK